MNQNKTANGAPNGADQPPVLYEDPKKIRRSPFNRTIDTKAPEFLELVESVRLHGVIEPPVVRRGVEGLELIAGERRTLAAIEARQTQIPVILRVATDLEVLELQTIENDQREDLSPIQRAEKYAQLLRQYEELGMKRSAAIEKLAERVGKKRSTVYEVLSLLELPAIAKEAITAGRLPASHAALVGKIKDPELQKKLVKYIAPKDPNNSRTLTTLENELGYFGSDDRDSAGTLSFREAKELLDDVAQTETAKAKWLETAAKHTAKGGKVIPEEQRSKYLGTYGRAQAGFVTGTDATGGYGGRYRTYKELMGKHAPPPLLTHDDRYKPIEIYEREAVKAAIQKAGHKWTQGGTEKERKEERERREREEAMQPVIAAAKEQLLKAATKAKPKFPWRFLIKLLQDLSMGPMVRMPKPSELTDRKIGAVLVQILVGEYEQDNLWSSYWKQGWDDHFADLCKHYGIDLKKLEKELAPPREKEKKPQARRTKKGGK